MPEVRMVLPQEQIACFYCSLNCHISFGKKLSYTWNLWMDVFLCVNRSKADVRQIPYLYCQMEERHWLNNAKLFTELLSTCSTQNTCYQEFPQLNTMFQEKSSPFSFFLILFLKPPFIISFVSFSDRYHSSDFKHIPLVICFPAWHPVEEPPPLKFVVFLLAILWFHHLPSQICWSRTQRHPRCDCTTNSHQRNDELCFFHCFFLKISYLSTCCFDCCWGLSWHSQRSICYK